VSRVLQVSTTRGSDLTGDGSIEHPYESVHAAIIRGGYDPQRDALMVDNFVSSERHQLDYTGRTSASDGSLVTVGACAAAVLIGFVVLSPGAALLCAVVVAGGACVARCRQVNRRVSYQPGGPRPGFRQDGRAKP